MFQHVVIVTFCAIVCLRADAESDPAFRGDVAPGANPWSGLAFNNAPENFQFAIVADNTGGWREGVFEDAVRKLNLLQPEFVMSVGDLIEGGLACLL